MKNLRIMRIMKFKIVSFLDHYEAGTEMKDIRHMLLLIMMMRMFRMGLNVTMTMMMMTTAYDCD